MVDGPPILRLRIATLHVEEDTKHGGGNAIALHQIMEDANVQGVLLSHDLATYIHVQVYQMSMNTRSTKRCFYDQFILNISKKY